MSDTIRDMELQLIERNETKQTLADEMDSISKPIRIAIETAWSLDRNKELSNQAKRDAKVDEILDADVHYQTIKDALRTITEDTIRLRIDLNYETRKFQREMMGK